MTILATSLYRQGVRIARGDGCCCPQPGAAGGDFVWIDLADPTPADLMVLQPAYDLSRLAAMEVLDAVRQCRCEHLGELCSISLPFTPERSGDVGQGGVAALVGPRYIITVSYGRCLGHRRRADGLQDDPDVSRPSPEHILHAFLSEAIGEHDRVLCALRDEVIACGQQILSPGPIPAGHDVVSKLWVRVRSVVETLHRLDEMQEGIGRHIARASDTDLNDLFRSLSGRVRRISHSADSLLQALDTTREYLDHKAMPQQRRSGTMLATLLLVSAALLLATRLAAISASYPALGLWMGIAHSAALVLVALSTTTILVNHLKRRPGRGRTLHADPRTRWRES